MPTVINGVIIPDLSRYEIQPSRDSIIGAGGMGVVLKATDLLLDREVAIKTINPTFVNPNAQKLFFREAAAHARLSINHSEKIVPVRNFGIEDGTPFMELELLCGGSLRDRLNKAANNSTTRRGPLFDEKTIKVICIQIAVCLQILINQ